MVRLFAFHLVHCLLRTFTGPLKVVGESGSQSHLARSAPHVVPLCTAIPKIGRCRPPLWAYIPQYLYLVLMSHGIHLAVAAADIEQYFVLVTITRSCTFVGPQSLNLSLHRGPHS